MNPTQLAEDVSSGVHLLERRPDPRVQEFSGDTARPDASPHARGTSSRTACPLRLQ